MSKKIKYKFTPIPIKKDKFYSQDDKFNIIHLYILERVRSFQIDNKICYISNEQFSKELNFSVSTIRRAIKLLIDKKFLYAKYNTKDKKRILSVNNEAYFNPDSDYKCYIAECWEANKDSMSLEDWISEVVKNNDFSYNANELRAIIDEYCI